jgi:CO/xanthine dehydrogenase Mo-binding subunit
VSGRPRLSPSLQGTPQLDRWIRIDRDGTIHVHTGKAELGQGLRTAIARIAAEELDVPVGRIRVHTADTAAGPVEFPTVGSMSMEHSGTAVRQAAAEARKLMVEAAARRMEVPAGALEVRDGCVRRRGSEGAGVDYAELQGGRPFEHEIRGEAPTKSPADYRIVGRPAPRIDLPGKLRGGAFLTDIRLPGMLFGRVVRPPSESAELVAAELDAIRVLPGVVQVVRDGRFLGVVAEREDQAERARERLRDACEWRLPEQFPTGDLIEWLRAQPCERYPVVDGTAEARPVPPHVGPPRAAVTLSASYARPLVMHASIGPSAAIARLEVDALTVWSHSQGVATLRLALAEALALPRRSIRVIHADGPGCYGHNGADDAALDAVLLARAVPGRPVLLQWTREDEHCFEPYGPAACVDLRASLDADGRIIDWSHETTSLTHVGRPMPGGDGSQLLASWHLAAPQPRPEPQARLGHEVGIHRNAWPAYEIPKVRVVKGLVKSRVFRTSSLRSLGAFTNVFAIESFVDELAAEAGVDPVELRLRHLADPRARAVVEAVASRAAWRSGGGDGRGQGFAFARYENDKAYAAVVVEVSVGSDAAIRLERAWIAADAGQVVDPSGLVNQLEGGFLQAASWTLREEVRFDARRITSTDWESYPILTFPEVPEIETVLVDRPDEPILGAGEAAQGPTPAAIANAVFHATGARLRRTPFTPERVREAQA